MFEIFLLTHCDAATLKNGTTCYKSRINKDFVQLHSGAVKVKKNFET